MEDTFDIFILHRCEIEYDNKIIPQLNTRNFINLKVSQFLICLRIRINFMEIFVMSYYRPMFCPFHHTIFAHAKQKWFDIY